MAIQYGPPSRGLGGVRFAPAGGFNPAAYVPGGSSAPVTQAIQSQGFGRPGATPAPVAAAPAPAVPARGRPSLTAAQVANQQVNQQLNPQLAAQNAYSARQNQAITQFAQALLGQMKPVAGQLAGIYDNSIAQTGALAGQSARFLQNANPASDVTSLEQSVGAPLAQQAQSQQQLANTFGGGAAVQSFLGGQVPGQQLIADKDAAVQQASQYPLLAGLQGQQSLASALGTQADARNTLLATRPALYQQALQDVRTNQASRASAAQAAATQAEHVREFGITEGDKTAAAQVGIKEFNIGEADKRTAAAAKTAAAQTAAQKQAKSDFLKWAYSPAVVAQGYSAKDMASIAKSVYGLDIGKGFSVAPPAPKPNWQVISTASGQYAVNRNDPTAPEVYVGTNKPSAASTEIKTVSAKDGTILAIDPTSGKVTPIYTPAPSDPKVNLPDSKALGVYVDASGTPIPKLAGVKPPKGGSSTSGLTAGESGTLMGRVQSVIHTATTPSPPHYYGGQPVAGSGGSVQSYQAVRRKVASLIPPGRKDLLRQAINMVNSDPAYAPGENGRQYETIEQALPNINEQVTAAIKAGHHASAAYQGAIGTGVFPSKLRQALVYEINRIYTQDYFQKNPNATALPAGVLVNPRG